MAIGDRMLGWVASFHPIVAIHLFSFDPLLFGCYLCREKKTHLILCLCLGGKELNDHSRPLLYVKAYLLQLEMCGHKEG